MAMRAHLQQRLDTIAIMKSLGASSGQIMKIYLLQTLLLGLLGGVLGVALGVGVQMAFPHLLAKLLHVQTEIHVQRQDGSDGAWRRGADDAAVYAASAAGYSRSSTDSDSAASGRGERRPVCDGDLSQAAKNGAQIGAAVLILAGLAAIATTL